MWSKATQGSKCYHIQRRNYVQGLTHFSKWEANVLEISPVSGCISLKFYQVIPLSWWNQSLFYRSLNTRQTIWDLFPPMLFLEMGNVICISLKIIPPKLNPDIGTYCFNYYFQKKKSNIKKVQSKLKGLTEQKEIRFCCKKYIWLYPSLWVRTRWINGICDSEFLPACSPMIFQ